MSASPPSPPSHLLLATDLSAHCDRATDRALQLAAAWGARLSIVHALEVAEISDDSERAIARARARARRLIEQDIAVGGFPDIGVHIETGRPDEVILELAQKLGCDLIVTGTSRADWLGQSVLGSTATAVTRQAGVPVLVVKKRGAPPYRQVVVATDLSDASLPAMTMALQLFGNAELTVFNAFTMPLSSFVNDTDKYKASLRQAAIAECRAALERLQVEPGADPALVAEFGDPATELAEYAAAGNVDLVLAGTHGRTGLLDVLLGSVAADMLVKVPCDVLVVPSTGRGATAEPQPR